MNQEIQQNEIKNTYTGRKRFGLRFNLICALINFDRKIQPVFMGCGRSLVFQTRP